MSKFNYKRARISAIILCSLFMTIGTITFFVSLSSLFSKADFTFYAMPLIVGSIFFFAGLFIMRAKLKELDQFEKMTYEWYLSENPKFFNNGRVSCCHCGEKRIHVRNLMNQTFHREHFCTQCGKTLYYSPE